MSTRMSLTLVLVVLASAVPVSSQAAPSNLPKGCAFGPIQKQRVDSAIRSWYDGVSGGGESPTWSLSANSDVLKLRLDAQGKSAIVEVGFSGSCDLNVSTIWNSDGPKWFSDDDARRLVDGLDIAVHEIVSSGPEGSSPTGSWMSRLPTGWDILLWLFCAGYLAFSLIRRQDCLVNRTVSGLMLTVVVFLFARPLFGAPFSCDAQYLRVAFAARDVFADWNHPFLSYLLNRPAALLSSDPVVLRIIPFLWTLAETLLFVMAARAVAGSVAAAFVGLWMASSIRLTMGMIDLSDWNLAGIFLALMLIWLIDHHKRSSLTADVHMVAKPLLRDRLPIPALLIVGGCLSSYLMIVPSAVLTLILIVEWIRRRVGIWQPISALVAVTCLGLVVIGVFTSGSTVPVGGFTHDLAKTMRDALFVEPPLGLATLMPLLIAAGFFLKTLRSQRPLWWFCLASFLLSVLALAAAVKFSSVNGAYYLGLFRGTCFFVAAVFVSRSYEVLSKWLPSRVPGGRSTAYGLSVAWIAALFLLTFRVPPPDRMVVVAGIEHVPEFVEMTGRGNVRVYSNLIDAINMLEYSEAVNGRMDLAVLYNPEVETWVRRTVLRSGVDKFDCLDLPSHYLVLLRNSYGSGTDASCRIHSRPQCRELFVKSDDQPCESSQRLFCFFECGGGQESSDAGN